MLLISQVLNERGLNDTTKMRIGILAGPALSPNEERELVSLGRMLSDTFILDTISAEKKKVLHPYFNQYESINREHHRLILPLIKALACWRYILKRKPDVLFHLIDPNINGLIIAIVGKLNKVKVVTRVPGDIFSEYKLESTLFRKVKLFTLNNIVARLAFILSDRIIAIGTNLSKPFVNHPVVRDKVTVIPQPLDLRKFHPDLDVMKVTYKHRVALSEDKKIILFVGRLTRLKGMDTMISIIEKVIAASRAFVFCLIGEGPYKTRLQGIDSQRVKVLGRVEPEEIDKYYKAADLFLFPSLTEGCWPNVVLEALASEVPVAASRAGDMSHLLSQTFRTPEQYVQYILQGHWIKDPLPDECSGQRLRQDYISLFLSLNSDNDT